MAPKYKLTYFDIRGRAELSRYLFAVAKKPYEDVRINGEQWKEMKESTPFGHLPILEKDGEVLSESNAIARFLAKEFGLAGKGDLEAALCDQFIETCADVFNAGARMHSEKDETKKEAMQQDFMGKTIPTHLATIEKFLIKNGGEWLVGKKISVADLSVFQTYDNIVGMKPDLLDAFPKLKSHRERVGKELDSYIKKRKETPI